MKRIAMLSTGEEVLHGDIVDTNAAWLSRKFYEEGLALSKRSTVGDQKSSLVNEFINLSLNYDIVIVNGGLGPTSDDLTAEAAAEAAEEELTLFKEWLTRIESFYQQTGRKMPESNIKQAVLPASSEIVDNPIGTACGFKMQINMATFYFTPGVPREFKVMIESQVVPDIKASVEGIQANEVTRLYTFGLSESGISDLLNKIKLPEGYEFGYRSSLPFIEVKLFGPAGQDEVRMKILQLVYGHLADNVVSVDEPLLANIGSVLAENSLRVSVSERSTGGYLSSWMSSEAHLESVMGQSWVLSASSKLEGFEQEALASALALAASIREKTGTQIGLSTGKLEDNTIAVAMSMAEGDWGQIIRIKRAYETEDLRKLVSTVVLDMLRRRLEGKSVFGQYTFIEREKELFIPSSAL
ncbi:CinA family nicotinamide mononucleotide deamidase-related protein [Vibrio sp. JC009]|uniref:CinA family nicotinamide mononucleotide deamidase-related protein n=1 Tax=Vibrio sp. JC009 TaxID=2912314 RepID=UPI0023B09FA9|nr:CinA family nicotinamide mononucleotide deamidase-related protein [Vibrio sp. JC009]WED20598.1 CinA family nicotinamide mononucleotide deamidase-related protein [Vibrio sp. JC009]